MILVFFMEWLEGFGIYHFGIIVVVGDFFSFLTPAVY